MPTCALLTHTNFIGTDTHLVTSSLPRKWSVFFRPRTARALARFVALNESVSLCAHTVDKVSRNCIFFVPFLTNSHSLARKSFPCWPENARAHARRIFWGSKWGNFAGKIRAKVSNGEGTRQLEALTWVCVFCSGNPIFQKSKQPVLQNFISVFQNSNLLQYLL